MSEVRLGLVLAGSPDPFAEALLAHPAVTAPPTLVEMPSAEALADVDGVYVAPEAARRGEAIVEAGRAGRWVLAPGRLAGTVAELDGLEQLLGPAASLVFAPHPLRFSSVVAAVQRSRDLTGTLRVITAALRARQGQGLDWRDLLADLSDYVLSLTGGPAERVHASAITPGLAAAPVGAVVVAALPGDVLANLECSTLLPETYPQDQVAQIEIVTSEAVLRVEPDNQAVTAYGTSGGGERRIEWSRSPATVIADVFVRALQGQPTAGFGLEAQREVTRFIAQVERSIATASVR